MERPGEIHYFPRLVGARHQSPRTYSRRRGTGKLQGKDYESAQTQVRPFSVLNCQPAPMSYFCMQLFGEFGRWFTTQPPCSRWLLILSLLLPILLQLSILPVTWLVYYVPYIAKGQVWRCVTALFLAKPSLPFLFNVYFRYLYSTQLETSQFARSKGDYAYFLILSAVLLNVLPSQVADWRSC